MVRSPLLSDMFALRNSVDRFVSESLGHDPFRVIWSRSGDGNSVAQPIPLDVYATDEHAVVLAALPGMRPDDLDLSVHQNTVTLSGSIGNVPDADETKGATWYVHELASGSFRRSVTLPFPVDADAVEASFEQGILRIVLPKAETARPRKIAVSSGRAPELSAGAGSTDQ